MRFLATIRFGIVLAAAVFSITSFCLWRAAGIIDAERASLLADINHSVAVNSAGRVRATLVQIAEKIKSYSALELLGTQSSLRMSTKELRDSSISSVQIFHLASDQWVEGALTTAPPEKPLNAPEIVSTLKDAAEKGFAFWRAPDGTPASLVYIACRVGLETTGNSTVYVAVGAVEWKRIEALVKSGNFFASALVTAGGQSLLHFSRYESGVSLQMPGHPFLPEIQASPQKTRVGPFTYQGVKWVGAFSPIGIGDLYLISHAKESQILSGTAALKVECFLFALLASILSFGVILFLEKTITEKFLSGFRRPKKSAKENSAIPVPKPAPAVSAELIHEVASPLASIQSRMDHALGQIDQVTDPDKMTKMLQSWESDFQFVKSQAEHLQRLVEGMRSEKKESEQKAEVHCHKALEDALDTFKDTFATGSITIDKRWGASEDTAFLSTDRLIQMVSNIVRNSLQAIQEQGGSEPGFIKVETSNAGGQILIDIMDNGSGITPEDAPKIFDEGFTTRKNGQNQGLGLAICRRFAKAFGGDVVLKWTEPGKGSWFQIQIPLHVRDTLTPVGEMPVELPAPVPPPAPQEKEEKDTVITNVEEVRPDTEATSVGIIIPPPDEDKPPVYVSNSLAEDEDEDSRPREI